MKPSAIVLANGYFQRPNGKAAHGLVRGSERFRVLAVVDPDSTGWDAGELLDGIWRDIPITASIQDALTRCSKRPEYCVVGIATHGGHLTAEIRALLLEAANAGLSLVNGLHDYASDDPDIAAAAHRQRLKIIDVRKPKPKRDLHFWIGAIDQVQTPRVAVLGTDCAIGKRTTARLLTQALNGSGIRAEMIYTGQTGWMQGGRYGLVLDSVVNDYVSGELEHAIVSCDQEVQPDVMVLEGQSSLRNPSGPCGSELLLSARARGVILQHAPGRVFFEGYESRGYRIPSVASEIELIGLYGARTLALTLHGGGMSPEDLEASQRQLQQTLAIPVVRPLVEGVNALVPVVREFIGLEMGQ
jgi:uncharacterized NAD-dependent epimerase/dehydratase family protein